MQLDSLDRQIINTLQKGFPVSERPYHDVAEILGTSETELLSRLRKLLDDNYLTRFGPMYQVEKLGGTFTLAAMKVPIERFDSVAAYVNSFYEVAHNYQRDHDFNMWFVIATEKKEEINNVIDRIKTLTGIKVYNMPKQQEFFIKLQLHV